MTAFTALLRGSIATLLICYSGTAISKPSVNLDVVIQGEGTVVSEPAGINCPTQCTAQFTKGTVITLTASGTSNYEFSSWSGTCIGTQNACELRLLKPASATATFSLGNLFPLAEDDRYTTDKNIPVQDNVMTNDYEGDAPATVTFFENPSISGGSIIIAADGAFSYTPPTGFVGLDSVEYTITDANGDTSDAQAEFRVLDVPEPPTPVPAPVAQTGQVLCYDTAGVEIPCAGTGQDGDTNTGVVWPVPRFIVNGDGTITDELTGLIWLQKVDCLAPYTAPGFPLDWDEALSAVDNLQDGQCGLTDGSEVGDWRLPNANEYLSLVDYQFYFHAIPNTEGTGQMENGDPFICDSCLSENMGEMTFFWTSTTSLSDTAAARLLRVQDGSIVHGGKLSGQALSAGAWAVKNP